MYGFLFIGEKGIYTHRLSLFYKSKKFSKINVLHKCDVRNCVNPKHLFEGTQSDNIHDAQIKGRHVNPPKHFGLNNSNAKLTFKQVLKLRSMKNIPQRELARIFNISQSTAWRLRNNFYRKTA